MTRNTAGHAAPTQPGMPLHASESPQDAGAGRRRRETPLTPSDRRTAALPGLASEEIGMSLLVWLLAHAWIIYFGVGAALMLTKILLDRV